MIEREQWEFRPEWLEWVREVWLGGRGRVQQQYPDNPHPCRAEFALRAAVAFGDRGIPAREIKTWVSVQQPESGSDYADGYPHVHYPLDGVTLVHYLQASDRAAQLEILDDDDVVVEVVNPERGMTVFMPNSLRHGVRRHHGSSDRIQLIATALP